MPTVDAATATPRQLAALEASPQRDSPYFQTLAHDVDPLEQRSPLFHAVMYVPRGLPRADRELATVVVSIINGCVYCSSVHARRFSELTKQAGDHPATMYDEGLDTALEPRPAGDCRFRGEADEDAAGSDRGGPGSRCARSAWTICRSTTLIHAVAMFANANRLMQTLGEPVLPD